MDDDGILRIKGRLLPDPAALDSAQPLEPEWISDVPFNDPPVSAAVLIAIVLRQDGPTVLYTERASTLRKHSGQVAFPGGRVDDGDETIAHAALREADEEVGLDPDDVEIIGFMPPILTGTNFLVTPVVSVARPKGPFVANPAEVDAMFEVPLRLIADQANYERFTIKHHGETRWTWQLDYDGHRIWGITAHLTRRFRKMALDGMAA